MIQYKFHQYLFYEKMLVKVKDNESGREMSVTKKAYELRKHKYTFIKFVDDEGNDLPAPNQKPQPQDQAPATEGEKDVAPAVDEVVGKKKPGRKPKEQISSPVESAEV